MAGALASFFTNEIKGSFFRFAPLTGDFSIEATSFWLSIALTGLVIHGTQWAQNESAREAREHVDAQVGTLEALVHRIESLPPEMFLTLHQRLLQRAIATTIGVVNGSAKDDIEQAIRNVLGAILELAKQYDKSVDGAIYHANIMLFKKLSETECPNLIGLPCKGEHPDYIGCLELIPSLSTSLAVEGFAVDPSVVPIGLAVPKDIQPTRGPDLIERYPILPGAPWAFVHESFAGFPSIDLLAEWLEERGSMADKEKNSIRSYFTNGHGRNIASFASMPLSAVADGVAKDLPPIGVLNLHSNLQGILEEKGAERFSPLLEPFRQLLSILVVLRDIARSDTQPTGDAK